MKIDIGSGATINVNGRTEHIILAIARLSTEINAAPRGEVEVSFDGNRRLSLKMYKHYELGSGGT